MIKSFLRKNYPDLDLAAFALWSFGPSYGIIRFPDLPKAWNKLHENDLKLQGDGLLTEDLPKMVDLYLKANPPLLLGPTKT